MKIICISDIHLLLYESEEEKKKIEKLDSFFSYLCKNPPDKLIIAGDLFDVWYEYQMVLPKHYFYILHKLKIVQESGVKLLYLAGNHDFRFVDFFQKQFDTEIFFDDYKFQCGKHKFFISHGDEFTYNDVRYHILKSILRNRFVNFLFGLLHPDIGLKLGKFMSRSSKKYKKPVSRMKKHERGMTDFAKQKFDEGFDYVIMGHIHKPRIISFDKGIYINLGDWINHFSYLIIDENSVEMKYW